MATIRFGSTATGTLVWTVPKAIQSVSFAPTPPEPPVPPKATIVSYETPIRLSQTSRAVAKITQGAAAFFQWQWLDGHEWRNANTTLNPATDLDHHFRFPRVGAFNIRLQTLDADKHVTDTSSSTSRVVTVQPDTPEPPTPLPPNPTPVPPTGFPSVLKTDGKIFRTLAGAAWRWKGVSAFKLCRLFTDSINIDPFLAAYPGFNVLRVWDYTDWPGTGWASCTAEQWKAFCAYVGVRGWTVELTLLTNDDPARIPIAKALVDGLAAAPRPTNLVIEIGNEPTTHKNINTKALKLTCDGSGLLYASGNYESPSSLAFGSTLVAHTARDSEWPRRCHDLMEYYNGGGPHNTSEPAHRVPCIADEPAKPGDVAAPQPPLTKADDWRAYFGGCSILGAGATFHCETGKWGLPPTLDESVLATAALEGLNAFPADAPLGPYSRPNDSSLRTYVVGNYSVRVRPTTSTHPIGGFVRTGASDILWRR